MREDCTAHLVLLRRARIAAIGRQERNVNERCNGFHISPVPGLSALQLVLRDL
jgi:hypothetical protein